MCIPEDDKCPINDIVVDLKTKKDDYIDRGYEVGYLENLDFNNYLYYRNIETENKIVVKLNKEENTPKYIHEGNFKFDNKTYEDYIMDSSDYGTDDDEVYSYFIDINYKINKKKKLRKLIANNEYGDEEITSYILQRFNESINIDKTFTKISDNLFAGNYIGFKDSSHLKDYTNFELYNLYFIIFPNYTSYIFCFFGLIIVGVFALSQLWLIILNIRDDDSENKKSFCWIFIPYLIFFIGYFSYILYEYFNIYKNRRPSDLTKVKADPFLEDLLKEIQDRHMDEKLILVIIIMFSCSIGISLITLIIQFILERKNRFDWGKIRLI